ncbi:hypothetical protein KIN20_006907, partial [Parelaphostrongylus tenuis]
MFRGPSVLSELFCPISDCKRVNCRFYHEGRSNHTVIDGSCLDVPFPCEPQDYKFAFSDDEKAEETGSATSSNVAKVSEALPFFPYRAVASNVIGELPIDPNRIYSIADFGYLPHIPSHARQRTAFPIDGSKLAPDSMPSRYYGTSSMYAPEEPDVYSHASFSGYAPAPSPSSSVHVPSLCGMETYSSSHTQPPSNIGSESTEQFASKMASSVLSNQPELLAPSKCSEDSTSMETITKSSTAKKIKTLPLPKVVLPAAPIKSRSEQFKEYVGEVARLNEEIERLQKLQEQLKQEAKKIVGVAVDGGRLGEDMQTSSDRRTSLARSALENTVRSNKHSRETPLMREKPVVVEYTPTPLAELERLKEEEKKKCKQKDSVKKLSSEVSKERVKKESGKRRLLSESEISQLFEDDDSESVNDNSKEDGVISCKKRRTHLKKISSLNPSTHDGSVSPPTSKLSEDKTEHKTDEDCGTSGVEVSADTKPTEETEGESLTVPKKRIARESEEHRPVRVPPVARRKLPSAKEQLQARMTALSSEKPSSHTTPKTQGILTQEQIHSHRPPNAIGSIAKGEARTARNTGASTNADTTPKLRDPTNHKIPYSVRISFLNKIFKQYLEVCPQVEAIRNSEIEEKAIMDKVRHVQGYKVAAINLIGRIRNAKPGGFSKSKAVLSHDSVLAGRHVNDISIRVRKSSKETSSSFSENEFYNMLIEKYLMTDEQLTRNGYPRAVPGDENRVTIAQSHFEKSKSQKSWADKDGIQYLFPLTNPHTIALIFNEEFRLDPSGKVVSAECIYHFKGLQRRGGMRGDSFFTCCGADRMTPGCCVAEAHVSDTLNAEALREFISTPSSSGESDPRNCKVYAMDCEMVYGVWGPELARLSVVDMNNKPVLDVIVKPRNTVIDYNTRFSGLTANQVESSTVDLNEAQNSLFQFVNERSILIGHSLESDLKAMRLRHERVVDTAVVFEHRHGFPYKRALRNLASEYLQKIIQEDDSGHDSQEDSATCMSLMLLKVYALALDMKNVLNKVQSVSKTIWEHKKKSTVAGILFCVGVNYINTLRMNGKIRNAYALKAREYGRATVSAEEKPRRVTVLVNNAANERSSYDDFVKNALPLLHLAGIQVDVIKSDSESQMEALAAAVDTQEADAIYVVGGDGTLRRVVTGILQHRENGVLPIGVFPGGYDNLSLRRLVPDVFESSRDVRRMCESAMALIEDERRNVNAFELTV